MVNIWEDVRSCFIIAEPTFPPGYLFCLLVCCIDRHILEIFKNKMMIGDYQIPYSNDCDVLQLHHHMYVFYTTVSSIYLFPFRYF